MDKRGKSWIFPAGSRIRSVRLFGMRPFRTRQRRRGMKTLAKPKDSPAISRRQGEAVPANIGSEGGKIRRIWFYRYIPNDH